MVVPRILIAEDDDLVRNLLQVIVERSGCEAYPAPDGAEALRLLNEKTFDVLLLDLMMPVMNGYELLPHLRVMSHRPAVLVITAMMGERYLELDTDVVTAILHKPFDVDFLADLVAKIGFHMALERPVDRGELLLPVSSPPAAPAPTASHRSDEAPPPEVRERGGSRPSS